MNGYVYRAEEEPQVENVENESCESFLESYAKGNIDVGGSEPPESAFEEVPLDILRSGQWAPPTGVDERHRVRELYQYRVLKELNHDVKVGFDKFARLATLVCGTKLCIVNFLDDKTQYTSAEAAPGPFLIHVPMPKPLSICAHTVLRNSAEVFEIPDCSKDWRFKGKPYVVGEPYIRFYAGAPLRTKSGYNIGSLCVLDYIPRSLTPNQTSALKDIANMIMNDLDLYREKELVDLRGRMANSITQFTRGLVDRENDKDKRHDSAVRWGRNARKRSTIGWVKRTNSADRTPNTDDGVMGFVGLAESQRLVDESGHLKPEEENEDTDTESISSAGSEELDLKAMYRYACRLMRETLDVEGVCFIDIDGIDWKTALSAPNHHEEDNIDTHTSGDSRREFGAASSILGYSHTPRFGADQRTYWPSIARWDEEAEVSSPNATKGEVRRMGEEPPFLDPEFPAQTGHFDDGSYISARTGSHFEIGGFSNQFLAQFLSENPFGRIYNDGLPRELKDFLPSGVVSAILVPIYDFDQHPFAMSCAYSVQKYKWFVEAEIRYLEGFGSQILSQVLKKRIIMADRAKGIFISNISHELRSPLHGILASAEFLSDTRLDTLQRTFIDTIDSCGRTLLEVINHVLDFGKLTYIARLKNKVSRPHIQRSTSRETVPQSMSATPVDLMAVAEQVVESCYAGYEFKGLFGQVDIGTILGESQKLLDKRPKSQGYGRAKDSSSTLTVVIDVEYREQGWFFLLQSGAFQRILMNITGNALKYTSSGWVRVQLGCTDKNDIHLTVCDSGKGISADFLKNRMFSPFSQEDTLQAGTGLGMSIVKQVVERLGGKINVTSQVNVGTQVDVSLPCGPVDRLPGPDSCARVCSLANKGIKVFLAGFDKKVPASRLLYDSVARYVTTWYNMTIVDDVYSSDLIISDECPELLDFFQQTSPTERSAFALSPPADSNTSVYRAWQPLIVLCSNALRYEFFGQQAETGKIIDFSSKPCGPYKLARSLLFCLEQAETRRRSLEGLMEGTTLSSPPRSDSSPSSDSRRRGSFGKGVVRFSPTVRRDSADMGAASMYVPGRGFVPTNNASIVEPPQFVGMRRKSTISGSTSMETHNPVPVTMVTAPTPKLEEPFTKKSPRSPGPYNRRNPPKSIPISPKTKHHDAQVHVTQANRPHVLIVEDNSVNALILETFLRKRGYPFAKAENGLLAVQAVQARPDGFNVILMDIQMPVMDGWAATAAIRSIEQDREIMSSAYIVALTGLAAERDRELAFESGVDHFLTKPVSLKQLGMVIDDWEKRDLAKVKSDL